MKLLMTLVLCICSLSLHAQDPTRFAEEVERFKDTAKDFPKERRIVFTGSSSIRLWTDFKSYFPDHNVINTGFGGSETSDLLYYQDILIDQFKPKQVFIYEGDNDLNSGKSNIAILRDMMTLIERLQKNGIENIVIISPKPSIARWHLKEGYENLNSILADIAATSEGLFFADVWSPMLDSNGKLKEELFIEDGLHMNKKGYDLWIKVIAPLLL